MVGSFVFMFGRGENDVAKAIMARFVPNIFLMFLCSNKCLKKRDILLPLFTRRIEPKSGSRGVLSSLRLLVRLTSRRSLGVRFNDSFIIASVFRSECTALSGIKACIFKPVGLKRALKKSR